MNKKELENFWAKKEEELKTKISHDCRVLFIQFRFQAGAKNQKGVVLTESMLLEWCSEPDPKVECTFCGTQYPAHTLACRKCKEYKGIQPYIKGWSDWEDQEEKK